MDKRLETKIATLAKRQSQTCKVFECKIDSSSLSILTTKPLNNLFNEAKWFYNYCLGHDDINDSDTTSKIIPVKVKDVFENRKLEVLSGQMKQLAKSLKQNKSWI